MAQRGDVPDFFVSYAPADERWATWIAWKLESEGYRTLLQAWDFIPGENFMDLMDRGVANSRVFVALLSRKYLEESRYGRLEWLAAMRSDAAKVVPVRIDDCEPQGLLASITYVDLVGVRTGEEASDILLARLRAAVAGRAKPARAPAYPIGEKADPAPNRPDRGIARMHMRRDSAPKPPFPPDLPRRGDRPRAVSLLHVAAPRIGHADAAAYGGQLQTSIWEAVSRLAELGVPGPEVLVISGDLTEAAHQRQFDESLAFLNGLRVPLGIDSSRVVVVPGPHDVSRPLCLSYMARCEARQMEPQLPYAPKYELYQELFTSLYRDVDGPVFDSVQPWTLFELRDLRVAFAGLNSTMAIDHQPDRDHAWLGEAQAAWFAARLRRYEEEGWLRIGVMSHDPTPGSSGEPGLPRGLGTFDLQVGRRLNLLLCGPAADGPRTGELESGLLVLGAAGPARAELVVVSEVGVDRWPLPAGERKRVRRGWDACHATFSRTRDEPGPEESRPDWREPEPRRDPVSLLMERISEVCRARDKDVTIRRVEGYSSQLMLTRHDDGIVTQWRIGVHIGTPGYEELHAFLATDPEPGSEFVYQGAAAVSELREEAQRRGVRLRSFPEFQGLVDLSGYVTQQTLRLRRDTLYPPALYVPQRFRELGQPNDQVQPDLARELMDLVAADEGRFCLVLGDFGRGKTFVLRELARRVAEDLPHMVPILIELRALDKAHSVDGLVAAHLANHGEDRIDLRAFHYMLRQGRVVLLFDGFDELVTRVTYDRAADHLDTLLRAAEGKAKIVVTSRTQHFQSHAQVLTALGERVRQLPQRRVLSVEDFTPAQVHAYLVNRYGGSTELAERRFLLIQGIQDLLGLSQNPRMLSFVADLDEGRLTAVAGANQTISAAGLYREILSSWLRYEAGRVSVPGSQFGLDEHALWHAVTTLALRLWETAEDYLSLEVLTEVASALTSLTDGERPLGEVSLTRDQTAHAMGASSLLVRTAEGMFGFIHSSVSEWLVAYAIAQALPGDAVPLGRRALTQLTIEFLCDLADPRDCQSWAEQVLDDPGSGEVVKQNARRVSARLRTPPSASLRGASLQGEDLSYRDLTGVDLTGADLSEARLIGTILSGATLRDARLGGARLDEARLEEADLSGTDLSRAWLARADLRSVKVAGSRWMRAALLNVNGLPQGPELRGAAVVDGSPVDVEFAPAAIGVRHGFHVEVGRLPRVVAYSDDGGILAVGSEDGGVLIYDTATGLPVRTLRGHTGRVFAVEFGPGDRVLATGASDGQVLLWDPATGRRLHTLGGHREWAWPVTISPRGDVLATGDQTGELRLWSIETGELLRSIPSDAGELMFTAIFDPTSRLVATGYRDGVVHVRDADTGEDAFRLRSEPGEQESAVFRVVFSGSGDQMATGGSHGVVRVWETAYGKLVQDLVGHGDHAVYTIAWHPTDALLVSGDTAGDVRLWDLTTGTCRAVLAGHDTSIYWVAFSPSGDRLATADRAGTVRVWEGSTGHLLHELTGHTGSVWPFSFRGDGAQLAISDDQFTTRLWDLTTGATQHVLTGHGRQVTAVAFSADGRELATCHNDGLVRVWEPSTGRLLDTISGVEERLVAVENVLYGPRGRVLVTAGNDGRINILNHETGRHERYINVESAPIWALAVSPSGDHIATANDDDTVRIWWRRTGGIGHVLSEYRGRVRSIAFHPSEPVLVTGGDDSRIRLWDVDTGRLLRTLEGHDQRVTAVSFSADGTLLASAGWDGTARVWSRDGTPLRVLRDHRGRVLAADLGPVGHLLATAGEDLLIRLWDAGTGELMHVLDGHLRDVLSVSFSPDGTMLASGGTDGTVRIWSIGESPALWLTLIAVPDGWAALAPDGRYKVSGDVRGQFWHAVAMCRFDVGELDSHVPSVRQLPLATPF